MGIRFYKSSANAGTHIGNLWTSSGALLASATFSNETASGWQQVNFSNPIAMNADTTYDGILFAPAGHYSASTNFFYKFGLDDPPIHLLQNGLDGPDGIYGYSSVSAFQLRLSMPLTTGGCRLHAFHLHAWCSARPPVESVQLDFLRRKWESIPQVSPSPIQRGQRNGELDRIYHAAC